MRGRRRRRTNTGSEKSAAGQLMALSLFIMLLAFFIVLNTISTYEERKVKPMIRGIEQAFASKITEKGNAEPSVTQATEEPSINEGDTIDKLKALFVAQIPSNDITVSKRLGVMHVELDWDDFEAAVMAIGQAAATESAEGETLLKGFFLPTLVSLLKNDSMRQPFRMDMALNVKGDPALLQNQEPKRMTSLMNRMSQIAEKVESAGLQKKLMSIGVKKGKARTVEILFRPHVPFNPLGDDDG